MGKLHGDKPDFGEVHLEPPQSENVSTESRADPLRCGGRVVSGAHILRVRISLLHTSYRTTKLQYEPQQNDKLLYGMNFPGAYE